MLDYQEMSSNIAQVDGEKKTTSSSNYHLTVMTSPPHLAIIIDNCHYGQYRAFFHQSKLRFESFSLVLQ